MKRACDQRRGYFFCLNFRPCGVLDKEDVLWTDAQKILHPQQLKKRGVEALSSLIRHPTKNAAQFLSDQAMHHLRYSSVRRHILISSLAWFAFYLSFFVVAGLAISGILEPTQERAVAFGMAFLFSLFLGILNFFMAERCHCQLCQANLMRSSKCSRHSKARRFLGSYRLCVSCSVLATRSFRCPYCGEIFSLRSPSQSVPGRKTCNTSVRSMKKLPSKRR